MELNGLILVNYPKRPYLLYQIRSEDKKDLSIYIGVTKNYQERCYSHSKNRGYEKYKDKPLYIWMNHTINDLSLKVKMKIIEEGYTEEEAFLREQELIRIYKYNEFNVLNISNGGKGNSGNIPWNKGIKNPYTEEQLKNLSDSHIGSRKGEKRNPHSQETKDLIKLRNKEKKERDWKNPRKKKVYKYTLDGKLVIVYSCLVEAALKENCHATSIGEWCRKAKKPRDNNFTWSYKEL